jgi:hypothetical protein
MAAFSYATSQGGGELAVAEGDFVPGAEHIQEYGEASCYRDPFRASFGLDR